MTLPNKGICGNVRRCIREQTAAKGYSIQQKALDDAEHKMRMTMRRWPKCADEYDNFPVEGTFEEYSQSIQEGKLWDNPLRHELLDWLIEELEE